MAKPSTPPKRPRGRPRLEATDRAILDATVAVLLEEGYGQLSIEKVAARAGVGRPTIYRRFTSKAEVVIAAVQDAFEQSNPVVPDTGDAREDVRRLLQNTIAMVTKTPIGGIMQALVAEVPRDPELERIARDLEKARRALMRTALGRGVERGEFPADLPVDLIIDCLLGAIYFRLYFSGAPVGPRLADEIVQAVLPK